MSALTDHWYDCPVCDGTWEQSELVAGCCPDCRAPLGQRQSDAGDDYDPNRKPDPEDSDWAADRWEQRWGY